MAVIIDYPPLLMLCYHVSVHLKFFIYLIVLLSNTQSKHIIQQAKHSRVRLSARISKYYNFRYCLTYDYFNVILMLLP